MRDRWTPVRRNGAYCSPACGGGRATCSIERYEFAKATADVAAKDLGAGWISRVSENLGWHASVGSPCRRLWVSIYSDRLGRVIDYCAFLGPPNEHGGSGKWAEHGHTLRSAITNVLNAAQRDLGLISSITEGLSVPAKALARPPRRRRHSMSGQVRCPLCAPLKCRKAP